MKRSTKTEEKPPKGSPAGIIAVDPAFVTAGWAYWTPGGVVPRETGTVSTVPKKGSEEEKAQFLFKNWKRKLEDIVRTYRPFTPVLVIEWPEYYSGSPKGRASAGRGNLQKLFCGADAVLFAAFSVHWPANKVVRVPVTKWKGQMSKRQVDFRIEKRIGETYPDHVSDAVGLGLFWMGEF